MAEKDWFLDDWCSLNHNPRSLSKFLLFIGRNSWAPIHIKWIMSCPQKKKQLDTCQAVFEAEQCSLTVFAAETSCYL